MDRLDYGRMMQHAMRGLVVDVLRFVADNGLPGEHHLYITLRTDSPGFEMPDWLRDRFPEEIMIVLQHEFYDLIVADDHFSVKLSFSDRLATLVAPFDSILQFADPSAEFGLRFDASEQEDASDGEMDDAGEAPGETSDAVADGDQAADASHKSTEKGGEVVRLDSFRKK